MKNIIVPFGGLILLWFTPSFAQNNQWSSARPDGHAPISIMADHYHKKGEFMFSYRYMTMEMMGNLSTSDEINDEVVFQNYMAAPQYMKMQMHMIGFMYAPSDIITLMLMVNYISNTMDLKSGMGMDFKTESSGLGDIATSALIKIINSNRQSLHGNVGFTIPTGDIDQRDNTPMMMNAQLAYPMQLGSGTFDPFLGATYLGQSELVSWGLQSVYKLRVGKNSEDYSLGNRFEVSGWGSIKVSDYFSFSGSLSYSDIGSTDGSDKDMNPMMMPLFNTRNSGRSQLDVGVGANFYVPNGSLRNFRLGAEIKFPVTQNANGIQMKNDWIAVFGIQYAIGHHE